MKRLLFVSLILLLVSWGSIAQTLSRMQGWGLDFESIAWANNQEGIIVGENLIVYTNNGGVNWEEVLQIFDTRFYDVVYTEAGKAVAIGENGAIYRTSDGGKSWEKKNSGTQNNLLSIAISSPSDLTAVGENGELLTSSDAGETWVKAVSGTPRNLNDVTFTTATTGFIAADGGAILKSIDQGKTWTTTILTPDNALYGIAFSSELIGYAVGENGRFVKTSDGGQNWSILNSTTASTLRKVTISPADMRIVVAVGDLATVVKTINSGSSFTKPSLGATNTLNLKGITFNPASNLVSAVGQDGYLTNSTNGGTKWAQRLAGIRNNFTSVDFKNLNSGFIAGENGSLYLTSNGATTLTPRPIPESILIETIDFWNTSFGYTGSEGGKIYRTTNSGKTWVPVFTPVDRTISGFYLFVPSVLYLAGSQGYITSSSESGDVWTQSKDSNTTENLKDLMFFDYQYGFAIGENGQISWSNGGTVWETQPKLTEEDLNGLAKIDTARAFVVGNGGVILKTDDKAKTWKKINSGTTKNLLSIDFFGESFGFIAGEGGLVLVTSDGGFSWKSFSSGTSRDLNAVSAGTDQKAYFVGDDGTILAYNCIAPVGNVGNITGDSESCLQSINSYTVSGLPEENSEIVWRVDGGEILTGQGTNQLEVKWSKSGRNAILVSRSNFCGTGETSFLEINVASIPPAGIVIAGDGAVCQAAYSYSVPPIEGVSYTWAVTGGEISKGQGTPVVEIIWNKNGNQQLSFTMENRCGIADPIVKTIVVNSAPESPLGISGESRVGLGEQIYGVDNLAGLNYRWSVNELGGRIISGQGTSSIVVLWEKEGEFDLAVESQNECGISEKRILPVDVNIITALEPVSDGDLKIFPNPSQGELTISSSSLDSWSDILVINAIGQVVKELTISSGEVEVYLQGLPKGLLLIRFQGKNGTLSKKVLVK